mgnify:CR=1 FL=1
MQRRLHAVCRLDGVDRAIGDHLEEADRRLLPKVASVGVRQRVGHRRVRLENGTDFCVGHCGTQAVGLVAREVIVDTSGTTIADCDDGAVNEVSLLGRQLVKVDSWQCSKNAGQKTGRAGCRWIGNLNG